jgi:hypothetical protein
MIQGWKRVILWGQAVWFYVPKQYRDGKRGGLDY